jgi:Casein kinase II regulatory subunit
MESISQSPLPISSLHRISSPLHHLLIPHQSILHLPFPHPFPIRCDADIDGAFFGPTFPNLFFMTYEEVVPEPVAEQVTQHPIPPLWLTFFCFHVVCVSAADTIFSHAAPQSYNLSYRKSQSIFESLHFTLLYFVYSVPARSFFESLHFTLLHFTLLCLQCSC